MSWTLEQFLLALPYNSQPEELKALVLKGKGIQSLPKPLAFLKQLRKLDLSGNGLHDLTPILSIVTLTQLDLSNNRLRSLVGLNSLPQLTVLNVSHNEVKSLSFGAPPTPVAGKAGVTAAPAKGNGKEKESLGKKGNAEPQPANGSSTATGFPLQALLASHNRIEDVSALAQFPQLNTLVLSYNPAVGISSGDSASPTNLFHLLTTHVKELRKLSLTECNIAEIPQGTVLPLLTELRLARNKLSEFPAPPASTVVVAGLSSETPTKTKRVATTEQQGEHLFNNDDEDNASRIFPSLKILDISHNNFDSIESLRPFRYLQQLALAGNPYLEQWWTEGNDEDGDEGEGTAATGMPSKSSRLTTNDGFRFAVSAVLYKLKSIDGRPFAPMDKREMETYRKAEAEKERSARQVRRKEEGVTELGAVKRKRTREAVEEEPEEGVVLEAPQVPIAPPPEAIVRKTKFNTIGGGGVGANRSGAKGARPLHHGADAAARLRELANRGAVHSATDAGW